MIIDKPKTINCHTPHDTTTIKERNMATMIEVPSTDKFDKFLKSLRNLSFVFDAEVSGIKITPDSGDRAKFFSIISVFQQKMNDIIQVKEVSLRLNRLSESLKKVDTCLVLMEEADKKKALQKST